MATVAADRFSFVTSKIVEVWEGLIRRAMDAKQEFNDQCEQIEYFYSGRSDFMWNSPYQSRFWGQQATSITPPRFKVTIAKAFEYVAVMKPMLFWQMATRKVTPQPKLAIDPLELFGIEIPPDGESLTPEEEQVVEWATSLARKQASEEERNRARADVLEHVLNYFPKEQPGGLAAHINSCLEDALLTGVAFMHTKPYQFPDSVRTLVASERVDVKDVLVDPDCRDPLWQDAKWVAIRHLWHYTDAEEYFELAPGSLRNYTSKFSSSASWQRGGGQPPTKVRDVAPNLIEWYEIFSRAGCGNQLLSTTQEIEPEFDEALDGNAAYLCICKGCPYPLNLPSGTLMRGIFTDEQERGLAPPGAPTEWVSQQLRWPTEYWRDNKWPITKLAFYPHSRESLWPTPPLAPGIGELTAINILFSSNVQQVWDNRQQLCAVLKGAIDNLQDVQNSNKSPFFFEISPSLMAGAVDSINKAIQFLNRPEVNGDVMKTVDYLMMLFEQRTGMSPRFYGENAGAAPRSAAESNALQGSVNLRPEYMRKCVADWQSQVADMEVFCMYSHVRSSDLAEQLGPLGEVAYDMLVTNAAVESILRGCTCHVEASAIARPNREHDAEVLDRMTQVVLPVLAGHAAQFNDPGPFNGYLRALGEATSIDVEQFVLPVPEPDNETLQMQKAMQQAELQKLQAESAKTMAEAQNMGAQQQNAANDAAMKAAQAEQQMMLRQQDAAMKGQQMTQKLLFDQEKAGMDLQAKAQKLEADMVQQELTAAQKHRQFQQDQIAKALSSRQQMELRAKEARQKMLIELLGNLQKSRQTDQTHQQAMAQSDDQAQQEARRSNMILMNRLLLDGIRSRSRNGKA